jgi:hypothetical protein
VEIDVVRVEERRRRVRARLVALADVTTGQWVGGQPWTFAKPGLHSPGVRGVSVGSTLVARKLSNRDATGLEVEEVTSVGMDDRSGRAWEPVSLHPDTSYCAGRYSRTASERKSSP